MTATTAPRGSRARRLRPGPTLVVAVALALVVAALLLDLRHDAADRQRADLGWGGPTGAVGLLVTACAATVLTLRPRHRVGVVMAGTGLLWALAGLAESWVVHGLAHDPVLPLTGFALWVVAQFCAVLLCGLPVVLVLYPDGRLLAGWWRWTALACVGLSGVLAVALWFAPGEAVARLSPLPLDTGVPGLPVDPAAYAEVLRWARGLTLLSVPLAVLLVFVRQRRAVGTERLRLRWLGWAAVMCLVFGALALVAPVGAPAWVALVLCLAVTAVSVTIGVVAPEVTDVDALMGGTLVFAAVSATVVGFDLALVGLLDAVLGTRLDERRVTLLVLVVAVAAYGPLRTWFGALVRRALVGRRGDRYDVVAGLAARLEEATDVETQLPALAAEVADAFGLGYVRVEVVGHGGGVLVATHGTEPTATREVPIRYGAEEIGRLVLPDRGLRTMLSRRDQELLFDVVRQGAAAMRSSRLAADLRASRERLVLDREEDRRRIRRDLHDGLGPVLGGVAMRLDAVANALDDDPGAARRMVLRSRADITEALADVRRLVHDLRPPALDDLGLLDALRQQVERVRPDGVAVEVEPVDLPVLPAAVEVAAFRIASEGVTNAVRHAAASRITVRLVGGPADLLVEVRDDGRGIHPSVPAGVGLRSMRERADELGGHAQVDCPAGGGTRVRARLPLVPASVGVGR
ncbi:sensor histidine kinase [Nocardioides sp. SYSU D00038]|uniref:sensor histidine kinase n=1 Tax=Nocardioides sp. SYSU D00038 TaxID=2812554 RepID=UPI0027DD429C|nr:sensor histidine kinase [Nocardioides sp. SYSU D00038]